MKKLLTVLSALVITAGSSLSIVSCGTTPHHNDNEKTQRGQTWLKKSIPDLYNEYIKTDVLKLLTVGDKGNSTIKTPAAKFFKDFQYGKDMEAPANAATQIITYINSYLKSNQENFINWLKKYDNAALTTEFLSNVDNFIKVDESLTKINVVKNLWDFRQTKEEKDIQPIAGLSVTNYKELFDSYKEKKQLPQYVYTININLNFIVNYNGDDPSEYAQTKIQTSVDQPLTITLIDNQGTAFYDACVAKAINALSTILQSNGQSFILDANKDLDDKGFNFNQDKEKLSKKLIANLNSIFSDKKYSLDIKVNKIDLNSSGEWGQIDNNTLKDPKLINDKSDPKNYFYTKISKPAKSAADFLTPLESSAFKDEVNKIFPNNEKMFTSVFNTDLQTFAKAQSVPSKWTDEKYTWEKTSGFDTIVSPQTISYGTFKITSWGPSGGQPFGVSWDIPFFIVNNDMKATNNKSARESYYDTMINPLSNLLSSDKGSLFATAQENEKNHTYNPTVAIEQSSGNYTITEIFAILEENISNAWGLSDSTKFIIDATFASLTYLLGVNAEQKWPIFPGFINAIDSVKDLKADGNLEKDGFIVQDEINNVYNRYKKNIVDQNTKTLLSDSQFYLNAASTGQDELKYMNFRSNWKNIDEYFQSVLALQNFLPVPKYVTDPQMFATSPLNKTLMLAIFNLVRENGIKNIPFDLFANSVPKTFLTVDGLTINLSPGWDFDVSYAVGNYNVF